MQRSRGPVYATRGPGDVPLDDFLVRADADTARVSSTLFDTVAVQLAADESPFVMEELPLRVTDDGHTVIDPVKGRNVRCAMGWHDLDAFKARLTDILLG